MTLPPKKELKILLEQASMIDINEIDLRECPYQIENFTGEDILLVMQFQECFGFICIPNLKIKHTPYPRELLEEMKKDRKNVVTKFTFYLIQQKTLDLHVFYETNSLDNDMNDFFEIYKKSEETRMFDGEIKIHIQSKK